VSADLYACRKPNVTGCHYRSGKAFHGRVARKPGRCKCLGCGRAWDSPDVRRVRFCNNCTYSAERNQTGRIYRLVGRR
jgi:hypothetical protein